MWRNKRIKGFTLIELLVVIAIIALLISILLPSLSRARELSKRLVCGSNMKGIGTSCKIYANDNQEKWPVPAFRKQAINMQGISYLYPMVPVGYQRNRVSLSDVGTAQGSTALSVTRAFWMLVRSGDVTVNQFICPSSTDENDSTQDIDFYYDFTGYSNISYGYQVPFGPPTTRPREGMDNRHIVAADKGPFYFDDPPPDWEAAGQFAGGINLNDSPKAWRPFNSINHGGASNGEGQNCLYFDGHVSFNRIPAVGIDGDNIYTVISDQGWGNPLGLNRVQGEWPHDLTPDPYPGEGAFGTGDNEYASTDSLIYP
jgi:prepilin-type N-terminal cleavage/methylation domain-containing protein/prepilin-type processing-associated H-X9-DG protein